MRTMITTGAIDVCNFDASWGGGPTEWRRVAALALAYDVELGHHEKARCPLTCWRRYRTGRTSRHSPARDPIFWTMLANRPKLVDGQFPLSERPGLGWDLDPDFIAKYRVDKE